MALFGIMRLPDDRHGGTFTMPYRGAGMPGPARTGVVGGGAGGARRGLQGAGPRDGEAEPHRGEHTWYGGTANDERDALLGHLAAGGTATIESTAGDDPGGLADHPSHFTVTLRRNGPRGVGGTAPCVS